MIGLFLLGLFAVQAAAHCADSAFSPLHSVVRPLASTGTVSIVADVPLDIVSFSFYYQLLFALFLEQMKRFSIQNVCSYTNVLV